MTGNPIKLTSSTPVIPVLDASEAIRFYTDELGFALAFEQGAYAGVVRDGIEVHLDAIVNEAAGKVTCRFGTDGVDELFAELEPKGVIDPAEPIRDTPWGTRQFSVLDGCGNRLTFVRASA